MRKLIVFLMSTIDGYIAGPNGEIDWHVVDDEFNRFAEEQIESIDLMLFGRITYEGMANYWPTPAAQADDPVIAKAMNKTPKLVFSTSLLTADWENSRLVKDNVEAKIKRLKQEPGKDMIIFGSSRLAASLLNLGLVDECRMMVSPVAIGRGQRLFDGVERPLKLELHKTKRYASGNMLMIYQPA